MRSFLFLGLFGLAMADPTMEQQGDCLVNSGEAVSDAVDSALFIWAATKRCGKGGKQIKCEVDVSSSIKAINSMINVILSTVDQCGQLNTANKECGLEAGKFTEHTAGLTAALGQLSQKCFKQFGAAAGSGFGGVAGPVMCSIDLKNTLKNLFDVVTDLQKTRSDCDKDQKNCASNGLHIVGALSGMGQFLAGSAGQCKRAADPTHKVAKDNLCAQAALGVVEYLSKVADDGIELSRKCPHSLVEVEQNLPNGALRLYDGDKTNGGNDLGFSINLVLGALLPAAAVLGFVGGKRARNHGAESREPLFSDNE